MPADNAANLRADAMAAYDNGDYVQAAAGLERYLDRSPDDAQAWYRLGNAWAQEGGMQAALTTRRASRCGSPPALRSLDVALTTPALARLVGKPHFEAET